MRKTRSGLNNLLICAAVTAAMATSSFAAIFNTALGTDWFNAANYDPAGVPTAATVVSLLCPEAPAAQINSPGAVANILALGLWAWPGNLTVDAAGTLSVGTHILLGTEPGIVSSLINDGQITTGLLYVREVGTVVNNGTLIVNDSIILGDSATTASILSNTGDITVNNWLHLSVNSPTSSVFNMNSGTLNVGYIQMNAGASARLNLHGGMIKAGGIGLDFSGAYTIDLKGDGTLIVTGNETAILDYMIGAGFITGDGPVKAVYDAGTGKTTLSIHLPTMGLVLVLPL